MRAAVFLTMTIGYGTLLLIKLRDQRKEPDSPFLRWLCITLALATLAAISGIPQVSDYLETTTGVLAIWILAPATAGCAAVRATLLLWAYPLDKARPKIRAGLYLYGGAIITMVVLTLAARGMAVPAQALVSEEASEPFWVVESVRAYGGWAATPYVRDAYLVYTVIACFTWADATIRFVRVARLVDRRWLRRGIWALTIGYVFFFTYAAACGLYFIGIRFGVALPYLLAGGVAAAGYAGIAGTIGLALPVLGPRWDRMISYRKLNSLWRALRNSVPHVVLEENRAPLFDAWNPQRSDFRLYRRVIEIRDGILALRPYFDPDVATTARGLAAVAQETEQTQDAMALAAQITAAIRDKHAGLRANEPHDSNPPGPGGHDLDSELELLLPVADAFSHSQIVGQAAGTTLYDVRS